MISRQTLRALRRRATDFYARWHPSPWKSDAGLRVLIQETPGMDRALWQRALNATVTSLGEVQVVYARGRLQLLSAARDADVVSVWDLQPALVSAMKRVGWLNCILSGINQAQLARVPKNVRVTTSRGIAAPALAEHALLYLLAIRNQMPLVLARQAAWQWSDQGLLTNPAPLASLRVMVVGMGAAGTAVARMFRSLGMHVTGVRRGVQPHADCDAVASLLALDEWLPDCDVLVLTLPLDGSTRNLLSGERLRRMKRGAVLINLSRGGLVDETVLGDLLRDGHLGGAGLDVLATEPPSSAHPLRDAPRLILTPHTAGNVRKFPEQLTTRFAGNLIRFRGAGVGLEGELIR